MHEHVHASQRAQRIVPRPDEMHGAGDAERVRLLAQLLEVWPLAHDRQLDIRMALEH